MPRFARRLLVAFTAFLVALALLEVGLRVVGAIQLAAANRKLAGEDDGRPIVAFIGDSNIYGLYVANPETDTLPKQVEALSCSGGARGVRCVNLAIPAATTWNVVDQCSKALELHPVAVVARAGSTILGKCRRAKGSASSRA